MRAAASIVQEKDENILAQLQKRELNFNFRYRKQPPIQIVYGACLGYVSCHVRKPLKEKREEIISCRYVAAYILGFFKAPTLTLSNACAYV